MVGEFVVAVLAMLSTWSIDYYPAVLDHTDVNVSYAEEQTVITINKSLIPADIACTESMQPMMGCKNKALLEELKPGQVVNVGDIVAYDGEDGYIMHQVTSYDRNNACYHLKGINNVFEDSDCVSRDDMKYRAVLIIPTSN